MILHLSRDGLGVLYSSFATKKQYLFTVFYGLACGCRALSKRVRITIVTIKDYLQIIKICLRFHSFFHFRDLV